MEGGRGRKGLSLTELLVATILIGIVMVGVASFSSVVKQLQSTTDRSTILHLKTSAAMSFIRKDALLATGDPSSPGVLTYTSPPTIGSICFRHDVNDPTSYGEDIWVCYFYESPNFLRRCYDTPAVNVPVQSNIQCNTAAQRQDFLYLSDVDFFNIVNDADGRLQYIQITLAAVYDETAPAHPVTNPEYVLTAQISPPHHGR